MENNIYKGAGVIETRHGKFNLINPTFDIRDIAHSLGAICRYNGNCSRFYSVAEHSLLVSRIMQILNLGDPLEGLLHDGTEAYLSDVPAPFKQFLPDWQAIDNILNKALRDHFNIGEKTEGCKKADWIALFIEAYELVPSRGVTFQDPENLRDYALSIREDYNITLQCWYPTIASAAFMRRYREYTEVVAQ